MMNKTIRCISVFLCVLSVSFAVQAESKQSVERYLADIKRVEAYLNTISTLEAKFTQTAPYGGISTGTFYLSRPGKLRWEYDDPNPTLIIVKGSLVTHYDRELEQASHVPIDDSLAGFLTRKVIRFSDKNISVIGYDRREGRIYITITQAEKEEEGKLSLIFAQDKIELLGMQVVDALGELTSISFRANVYGKIFDSDLFATHNLKRFGER